jgi:uncharacterized protein YjbJ (UPF0337 family)
MKPSTINVKLNVEKGKLKQKFASLTDDDLLLEEGKREEMIGKQQVMFFQTKEEFDQIISTL